MEKESSFIDASKKFGKIARSIAIALYRARVERVLIPLLIMQFDNSGEWIGPALFSALSGAVISGIGRWSVADMVGSFLGAGSFVVLADNHEVLLDADSTYQAVILILYGALNVFPHALGPILSRFELND